MWKINVSKLGEISFTPTISNAKIVSFLRPFSDSVGAHEPVAAVQPPRARDDDHAARPRGHPGRGAAALGEGGPGGCERKIKIFLRFKHILYVSGLSLEKQKKGGQKQEFL